MTVIAWDGKTLAADRQGCRGQGQIFRTTKIKALPTGEVMAWTGTRDQGLMLWDWYENGAVVEDYPKFQATDDWTILIVARNGRAMEFNNQPVAMPVEEGFMAWGQGAPFALGAMAMGADACKAVEVASHLCESCGMGVDAFDVTPDGGQQ